MAQYLLPGMSQAPPEAAELLLEGARYGDTDDVQQALGLGASVDCRDEQGRTGELAAPWQCSATIHLPCTEDVCCAGLHMASANGCMPVVQQLLEAGAVRLL